jgi:hypothetical protein
VSWQEGAVISVLGQVKFWCLNSTSIEKFSYLRNNEVASDIKRGRVIEL